MSTFAQTKSESGSTIVVAMFTTLILGGFIAMAVDYTGNVARNAQRDRIFSNAVEIGDGCLELAFGSWRELSKVSRNPATDAFAAIPTPQPSHFPSFPGAVISNFKVQAVDPMVALSSENPPTSALPTNSPPPLTTGPGTGTFSYFYLATVDVKLPYISGSLTSKVRRVFEKRYTSAWNWAILYNDDLELHPNSNLVLNGWVHSNKDIYIGNGVAPDSSPTPPPAKILLLDRLTYAGNYNVGYSPSDPYHTGMTNMASPVTPSDLPPGREQIYSPFDWDSSSFGTSGDGNNDNDGYREMIEKPTVAWSSGPTTDPFKDQRLYNQAGIVVEVSESSDSSKPNRITVYAGSAVALDSVVAKSGNFAVGGSRSPAFSSEPSSSSATRYEAWKIAAEALGADSTGKFSGTSFQDGREGGTVKVINVDVDKIETNISSGTAKAWNGVFYILDTRGSSSKRGIRIINAHKLPSKGLTIVSENPVYIQGDFNTGGDNPPSNSSDPNDPEDGSYERAPASIIGDAITLLSREWKDDKSSYDMAAPEKAARNTTVNAALLAGDVPSDGSYYSGGGENFVRFLENWENKTFTYYGSMLGLYASKQAVGKWGLTDYYRPPRQNWFFDSSLTVNKDGEAVSVPGYISTVSYLQQQRWYLQY